MFEWKGFAKFWLWFVFIVNCIVLVLGLIGIPASLLLGPLMTVVTIVSEILEIVLIVGIVLLLFKKKKVGFYIMCGCQVVNIILGFIIGSGVRTICSAVISILILFFAIKNYWDQLA